MKGIRWYREPWPWILMSGPVAVLIAGAATMWIAFASADGLVAEDYYRQGLAINKVIAREDAARARGLDARIALSAHRIRIEMTGERPAVIFAHLAHATRAGHDLRLRLTPSSTGVYEAGLPDLPAGRWRVAIEDPQGRWRIVKEAL
jgi:hypothetical protein